MSDFLGKPFPEDEEVDLGCMLYYQTLRVVLSHPCHVVSSTKADIILKIFKHAIYDH